MRICSIPLLGLIVLLSFPGNEAKAVRGLFETASVEDDSDILAPALEISALSQGTCFNKNAGQLHIVGDRVECESLTPNKIRADLKNKMCKCTEMPDGKFKWRDDGLIGAGGNDSEMNAMFLGNIIGHAKMLCSIVESIDCWQGNPNLPKIPGVNSATDGFETNEERVEVTMADGSKKFAAKADIIGTVKTICKVINGGVGELPKLIPGIVDKFTGGTKLPGIPNLLGKIIGGIVGGGDGGSGGLLDRIGGLFGSIFMMPNSNLLSTAAFGDDTIRVYDGPEERH